MNKLAVEILNKIFIVLPSEDKVECMAVCKKWDQVIKTLCLFETIRIASLTQLNRVTKKIKNEPFQADQVERLILDLDPGPSFDLVSFINRFPNIRVVYMENSNIAQFLGIKATFNSKHIEYIFDSEGHAMTSYFLKSKQCTSLKQLMVNDSTYSRIPGNFINLFSYMPLLTKLTLCIINISFEGFEILHSMLPSLNSLSISGLTLTDFTISAAIEPATSVMYGKIGMGRIGLSLQTEYFEYVSKKYTSLLGWEYNSFGMTNETQESIDTFYKNGVVPFLLPLSSQLKHCRMDLVKMPKGVSDMLKQINYKKQHVGLSLMGNKIVSKLTRIIQTNRAECVVSLSIAYTRFSPDFIILKKLTALKELTVFEYTDIEDTDNEDSDQNQAIVLNDILKVCSDTVETLKVCNILVKFDTLDTREYKIKNLLFLRVCLDRGIDAFISRYLRDLDNLKFDSVRFSENKLFLSDLNLLHLQISDPIYLEHNTWISKSQLKVLVSTLNNHERRIYFSSSFTNCFGLNCYFNISDWSVYPQVKSVPYDKTSLYPNLTFELASVKKITINGSNSRLRKFENNVI